MSKTVRKCVSDEVRISYQHLTEPSCMPGQTEEYYSCQVIVPKDSPCVAEFKEAIAGAIKDKWGNKAPASLKLPLRDGDAENKGADYKNCYFFNAKCKDKPQVVDRRLKEIIDPSEIYSGMYGRVSVTFYAFDKAGNRGVAVGLNNVQKTRDGQNMSGRAAAADEFEALEDDDLLA